MPTAAGLRDAWRYARRRGGQVSIAVVDTTGRLRQRDGSRSYVSASVVKSMLLAAELRRLDRSSLPLDAGTQGLLKAMVTSSDNDAADAIYSRVGDTGLVEVAKAVGMRRFSVAGYWGNAQVTAADMARLFSRLDRAAAARAPAGGAGAAGGDRARPALGRAGGGEGVDGSLQGRLADHRSRSARTPGCPAAPGRSQPGRCGPHRRAALAGLRASKPSSGSPLDCCREMTRLALASAAARRDSARVTGRSSPRGKRGPVAALVAAAAAFALAGPAAARAATVDAGALRAVTGSSPWALRFTDARAAPCSRRAGARERGPPARSDSRPAGRGATPPARSRCGAAGRALVAVLATTDPGGAAPGRAAGAAMPPV